MDSKTQPLTETRPLLRPAGEAVRVAPPPAPARPDVRAGSAARYTDAVSTLLRQRLRTAAFVFTLIGFLVLLPTLHQPGLLLRVSILSVGIVCCFVLSSRRALSAAQLRLIDLVLLAGFVTHCLYMPNVMILQQARVGDHLTAVMDRYYAAGAWALFIVFYGLFIPNTWQRAALVIVPLAVLPELNFWLLARYDPHVQAAFAALDHGPPLPLTLMAALLGIYGAHTMYAIRRDAFRAKQLGQYRLREKLGSGGMGEVYRAEHELLKRPCAIKLLRPDVDANAEGIARFEREVQATARLSHWNTVEIYDYGRTDEGVFYYVMELLHGLSLADLLDRHGPLPPERVVYLLRQVCSALQEAHGLGLIHRDLKPANIFAARRGEVDDVAKLLDFGLVKAFAAQQDAKITRDGVISGSPAYMSPEQATADGAVDPRSDIYSLGAVAYDLLTGAPPFNGRSMVEVLIAHARDPVVPPSLRNPDVPRDLGAVVLRCLEKKPENRFQDVAAVEAALAACECASQWNAARAGAWWRQQAQPSS